MFVHKRFLQPQLENHSLGFLVGFWKQAVYYHFSTQQYTSSLFLSPSSAPGLCPDLEMWPLPGFHLLISRHIPHHLPPGILAFLGARALAASQEHRLGCPAPWAAPSLCPAGARGSAAAAREPEPAAIPGAAPPARAGPGWPRPRLPLVPARLRAAAEPGARIAPGSFAPPAVPHGAAGTASLPREPGWAHRLFPPNHEFRGKSRVHPKSAGGKEDLHLLHGESFVHFPLLPIIKAISPKTGCWARGGNINRRILWKLAVHFCGAQALHWKCRDPRDMGTRDHSKRRKNSSSDKKWPSPESPLTLVLFVEKQRAQTWDWEVKKTFKQSWYWYLTRIKLETVL